MTSSSVVNGMLFIRECESRFCFYTFRLDNDDSYGVRFCTICSRNEYEASRTKILSKGIRMWAPLLANWALNILVLKKNEKVFNQT